MYFIARSMGLYASDLAQKYSFLTSPSGDAGPPFYVVIQAMWMCSRGGQIQNLHFSVTVWHEIFARIFAGVFFCCFVDFLCLRELIFAVRIDWFLFLGTNFYDFQKLRSTRH